MPISLATEAVEIVPPVEAPVKEVIVEQIITTPSSPGLNVDLASMLGVSTSVLENIVIFGIIIAIVGLIFVLFWKFIVAGVLAIFCLVVIAGHKPEDAQAKPSVKVQKHIEQIQTKENPNYLQKE
jgi:lysylphosphatidylglycerol synthetase-like protein (DUF2156 family)